MMKAKRLYAHIFLLPNNAKNGGGQTPLALSTGPYLLPPPLTPPRPKNMLMRPGKAAKKLNSSRGGKNNYHQAHEEKGRGAIGNAALHQEGVENNLNSINLWRGFVCSTIINIVWLTAAAAKAHGFAKS
jgi:hypothetical protein